MALAAWLAHAAFLTGAPAAAQVNLGFEDPAAQAAESLPGWRVTGAGAVLDRNDGAARSGGASLRLTQREQDGAVRVSQEMPTAAIDGNRVRIAAYVETNGAPGPASLWVRVDGDTGLLYIDRAFAPRSGAGAGSAEAGSRVGKWTRVELEAPIAPAARRISFGAELRGRGSIRIDDFMVAGVDTSALPAPSSAAARYVERALAIIAANAVDRARVDWPALRRAVMAQARGATTVAESHLAVRVALSELGDGHSYFMAPGQMATLERGPVANARTGRARLEPRSAILAGRFGYLRLPGFAGGSQADQADFAETLQRAIADLDAAGACGWILDLRDNSGGNLWPMLAGIGPLLGDGDVGAALDSNGAQTLLWYRAGKAGLGEHVQLRVRGEAYALRDAAAPVAVLTDGSTASAAEIIAGAFAARPPSRSLGAATRGAVTGTRVFPLSDGAALVLAVARTRDRHGNVYDGPLEPDQAAETRARSLGLDAQPSIAAAREWLRRQPACAAPATSSG